eukprot:4129819-Pleurochrysis_carterae.AAC.1
MGALVSLRPTSSTEELLPYHTIKEMKEKTYGIKYWGRVRAIPRARILCHVYCVYIGFLLCCLDN